MQKIKLDPDDVLKGIGSYREKITFTCPECNDENTVQRTQHTLECEECNIKIEIQHPFPKT